MKKIIRMIGCLMIVLGLALQNVYAAVFTLDTSTATILYVLCGIFILGGIFIIIFSKFNNGGNKYYDDENKGNKHEIAGLASKEEIEQEQEKEKETFDADSIFKTIPTFASKKFRNELFDTMKVAFNKENYDKIKDKMELDVYKNIELINTKEIENVSEEIINFTDNQDKYVIETNLIIKYKIEENNKKKKIENKYLITSENRKESTQLSHCPSCGGKIKDPTLLRCKFCNTILPQTKKENTDKWIITKVEKKNS